MMFWKLSIYNLTCRVFCAYLKRETTDLLINDTTTYHHIHISIRGNIVYLNTGGEWKWGSFGASLNSLRCDSHPENRKHMSIIYGEKKQTHHWQKIAKRRKTRCTWKKAKNSSIQNRSSESSLYTCLAVTVTDVYPSRPMPVGQRWHTVAPSVLVKVIKVDEPLWA